MQHNTNIAKLYDSEYCELFDIEVTGRKETNGRLLFKGVKSALGSGKNVRALFDGVVTKAGRDRNPTGRPYRLGTVIEIRSMGGVLITYARLAARNVNVGDKVKAGDIIGAEGATGAGRGEYLLLEFRRNSRRIDGCELLHIPPKPQTFRAERHPYDDICKVFGLSENMQRYIDEYPEADELWRRLASMKGYCVVSEKESENDT